MCVHKVDSTHVIRLKTVFKPFCTFCDINYYMQDRKLTYCGNCMYKIQSIYPGYVKSLYKCRFVTC